MKHLKVYSLIVVLLITYRGVVAQTTKIKGQVFDKTSKLPIPFGTYFEKD